MKLVAVTVQKFRNFVEPQRIEIEPDVTALVGKNESGKTTILKAGRAFEKVAENRLEEGFMASPVAVGDALFLRTKTALYRIDAAAE